MAASWGLLRAPPRRPGSPFFSWCFLRFILVALVLRFPTPTDGCGNPPEFDTIRLKGIPKSSYVPGDRIYYECKPGHIYRYPFALSTFCERNNSWFPLNEACMKKACPTPSLSNGEIIAPQFDFRFDKEAHFYCNYGYYLKGEHILTCKLSGDTVSWNHAIPTCEKILCQPPGNIINGKHSDPWREVFELNEFITYSCDPSDGPEEYSLVGESKLICSGPGKWSSNPPECKVVICEEPVVKHGKPVSEMKNKFTYQDEVLFECLKGFYLNGSNPVFCGGNSTWEPEMPTCIKGFKPTHPTKPPVSKYPGYPNPLEYPSIEEIVELDTIANVIVCGDTYPGIIALIILTILQTSKGARSKTRKAHSSRTAAPASLMPAFTVISFPFISIIWFCL